MTVKRTISPMLRLVALAIALSLIPRLAWANAGIGYFMLALPIIVMALLPAILLEACVLAPTLAVPLRRALMLSFGANVRSTLWGLGLGIVIDGVLLGTSDSAGPAPTKAAATAMLVPLFFFSWWIEYRAIMRRATDVSRARITVGTGTANVLSYAAMIAFVWTSSYLPEHDPMMGRAYVSEALSLGSALETPVEEFWVQHQRFPVDIRELGHEPITSKRVAAIELRQKGVVAVILKRSEYFPDGGEITLAPMEDPAAKTLSWKCRSTLSPKLLPNFCRE